MPKPVNCCVPGCLNNLRNSPELQYYRIPKDSGLRKQYVHLIRNKTLKIDCDNTRICSEHFDGGKKTSRQQLPSLFPWTKAKKGRRLLYRKSSVQQEVQERSEATLPTTMETATETTTTATNIPGDVTMEEEKLSSCIESRELPTSSTKKPVFVDQGTQTETEEDERNSKILELHKTIERLSWELKQLKFQQKESKFNIETYKENSNDVAFYTGFQDYETLMLCYSIVEEPAKKTNYDDATKKLGRPKKLTNFEEFILVLMKLRLGLFNRDLTHRFQVSESTVSLIFRTWTRLLRSELEPLIILPPRSALRHHLPPLFKQNSPLIIDCTEFEMERPSSLDNQSACYSQYKSRTTMKALIGITPSGATAFVSELYPGSISDKEIVKRSGLLEVLQPGDEIMADKGFLIQDELVSVGATLVMLKFLKNRKQFTKEEAEHNKKVACLRVHVERCMKRIKNWHILDRKIPISLAPVSCGIIFVLAAFTNFLPPLTS